MFFTDLEGLIGRLKLRPLSQRESFQYLFAFLIYNFVADFIGSVQKSGGKADEPYSLGVVLGLTVIGAVVLYITWLVFLKFYNANGGDNGNEFLPRLIAIGWVVTCRLSIVVFPLVWIFSALVRFEMLNASLFVAIAIFGLAGLFAGLIWQISVVTESFERIRRHEREMVHPEIGAT